MSSTEEGEAEASDVVCGWCGVAEAEVDNVKLEDCGRCGLVKYCGDNCLESTGIGIVQNVKNG